MANTNITLPANAMMISTTSRAWTGKAWAPSRSLGLNVEGRTQIQIYPRNKDDMLGVKSSKKGKQSRGDGWMTNFSTHKTALSNLMAQYGVKIFGAYMVDGSLLPEIEARLTKIKAAWDADLAEFEANYDSRLHAWLNTRQEEPERSIILDRVYTLNMARNRFKFGWQTYTVVPHESETDGNTTADVAQEIVNSAMEQMADDIAEAADSYANAKRFSPAKLQALADKARALSFTTPEIGKLETVLRGIAGTGSSDVAALVLRVLSDPQEIVRLCDPNKSAGDVVDDIIMTGRQAQGQVQQAVEPEIVEPEPVADTAPVLPDVNVLVADALNILKQPMPVPPLPEAPKPQVNAVNAMMGMIDSDGLW